MEAILINNRLKSSFKLKKGELTMVKLTYADWIESDQDFVIDDETKAH